MSLHLKLFGAPRLERDGTAIAGRAVQRRRMAILVLLARATRRTLLRERVIGYLWPEHAPESARRLLTEATYVLRRELGDAIIATTGDEISLSISVTCDVDGFVEAAELRDWDQVVATHAAPLLDGWYVADAPDFEQWVEGERAKTNATHLRAVSEVARRRESIGDWLGAVELWQHLLRFDPYNSTAVVHCARARVAIGDRAGAMSLIEAHAIKLREDLGADLDTELVDLAADIREGRLQPPSRAPLVPDSPPTALVPRIPQPTEAAPLTPNADGTAGPGVHPRAGPRPIWPGRTTRGLQLSLGAIVGVAVLLGSFALTRSTGAEVSVGRGRRLDPLRIAVLYFESSGPDSSLRFLADGLTEGLIRDLSEYPQINVLSTDAVARFRRPSAPIDTVGQRLRAGTVIRTTIHQSGDKVRVLARVIDSETAQQMASVQVDAGRDELFALTDTLTARMSTALRERLGADLRVRESRRRPHTGQRGSLALAHLYQAQYWRRSAEDAWRRNASDLGALATARATLQSADSLLAVAESLDPEFAQLSIERGWVAVQSARLESGTARVVALSPALGHAERASARLRQTGVTDRRTAAEVHYLQGRARLQTAVAVQTFRSESPLLREAEAHLDSAVALDSTLAGAWAQLTEARRLRGEFEGAQRAAYRALLADAFLLDANEVVFSGWLSSVELGQAEGAREWCARGHALRPTDWRFTECALTNLRLDAVGLGTGRPAPDTAWALVRRLERMDPDAHARAAGRPYSPVFRRLTAAAISAWSGDTVTARRVLAQELARVRADPELSTDILYDAAFVHVVLRDLDAARTALRAYVRARPDFKDYVQRDLTLRAARPIE